MSFRLHAAFSYRLISVSWWDEGWRPSDASPGRAAAIINYPLPPPPPEPALPIAWTVSGLVAWSFFDFLSFLVAMEFLLAWDRPILGRTPRYMQIAGQCPLSRMRALSPFYSERKLRLDGLRSTRER